MSFEFPATTLYDRTGARFDFTSLDALVEFLEHESKEWSKINRELPEYLQSSKLGQAFGPVNNLHAAAANLQKLLRENAGERDVDNAWKGFLEQRTNSFADPSRSNSSWISITNPAAEAWRQATTYGQRASDAFFDYACKKEIEQLQNGYTLLGTLLAYEFQMQGHSAITQKRQAEEATFEQLRSQLLQRKNQLLEEIAKIQSGHSEWFEQALSQWNVSQQERQSVFEQQVADQKQDYESRSESQQEQFTQFMQEKSKNIAELEKTYEEKLALKGPAQYWKTTAQRLRNQGRLFGGMLIVVLVSSVGIVSTLLYQWIANGAVHLFNLQNLQGALLFASLVSLIAYTIKTFARLTFSSFHLQRDAEERRQLTYLYLALGKNGDIDADSRKILYQALFSRSESGLLHKEQGPTMPNLADSLSRLRN